jgi:acyl-CoA reductase-like NAD-dependent aldehyde dehydrogenase
MIQLIKGNYINGNWLLDNSLKTKEIINPAKLTEVVGSIQWADKKVVKFVLESANKAKKVWKKISLENRIILANTLLDKIVEHKSKFAQIITLENGKTIKESLSEVNASVDESRFQIDYLKNHLIEKTDKIEVRYEPIGVVLTITPWNFPLATIMRKMIPAIVCGNSVIVKPSEYAPLTSVFLFELIDEMEFPIGVINLVNGIGSEIVTELLQSDCIKAISFTGSDFTGKKIAKLIGGDDIRFQAEMGGSNAVVVLNDANLKIAVPDIISNGFACGGQWCTGTSRVIAEKGIYNKLIEKLKQSADRINTGNGTKENVDMGPLSNERQFIDV